jgi:hypothetical protein
MCDVNGDQQIDSTDLALIRNSLGMTPANLGARGTSYDPDGDNIVTVNDLRLCALMCTNAQCATTPPPALVIIH